MVHDVPLKEAIKQENSPGSESKFTFFVGPGNNSELVRKTLERRPWQALASHVVRMMNVLQVRQRSVAEWVRRMGNKQYLNHLDGLTCIGRKNELYFNLKSYWKINVHEIAPPTFVISVGEACPEYAEFCKVCKQLDSKLKGQGASQSSAKISKGNDKAGKDGAGSGENHPDSLSAASTDEPGSESASRTASSSKTGSKASMKSPSKSSHSKVKPTNNNRGNGIRVFRGFSDVDTHLKKKQVGSQVIVQKYIERPLLYKGRKFDIRCLVLVDNNMNVDGSDMWDKVYPVDSNKDKKHFLHPLVLVADLSFLSQYPLTFLTMEAAEAEALLGALLLPQNDGIKAAEQRLKAVSSSPSYTILLIDRAMSSPSPQIRQLAAVLARRKCIRHWDMMGDEDRGRVRSMLEHMLAHEPEHLVRRSIAELVSSIAKLAVPAGQWTGLLQFLLEASESDKSEHREVALMVFSSLTDSIGSQLRPHFQQLVRIFLRGMSDAAAPVRMAALAAAGNLIQWLESGQEKAMGAEMVPSVLQVTQHCIEVGEEETALQAVEMLTETIDSNFELLEGHLATLVKFMLDVSCAKDRVEVAVREKAMMFVTELCGQKAKLLKKKHMIPMILQATFTLASEGGEEEDEDADEEPVFKFGTVALDVLSQQLSSRVIVPQVMSHVMANVSSPDKFKRRGALYILGVCAEGCSESYVEQLDTILPWLLQGLGDQEKVVKEHACWALVQCAEFCQPEIMEHYEQVLPGIFRTLQEEAAPNVRRGAMFALDAFCENLGEELEPYLEELMRKMLELLHGDSLEIRELAISAIASAAGSSGEKFVPYYPPVMQQVLQLMHLTEDDALSLRARATECGAVMAVTVGKEKFAGDSVMFVQLAMAGLQLDSNELREYTYGAFANLAGVLQEEMLPLLPSLLPKMIESIESEDGVTEVEEDGAPSLRGIVSPDSDDEDESDPKALAVRTAWLDEKVLIDAVADLLGVVASVYGQEFR
ncbi:hypothetical protein GUITHDRAFT_104162 [Guillardia theta CCMP2712]|uniref:Importin N-terminal domain-containing protein n=2 Tax=Guillardia theta TaxID=55529 RepID=L1JPI8_GUITC|nr:hypothetical protein GUITHDRAFT_104162 [Guillardia theta CCMP2712]EKX50352.1 hypothetical protein GUITHDRAFT_104162 [Guillardia theta CCMP2712]|eukprot:XP_005837332.1 hypothetical protein GUITHDRAFT_104162 [Guillardia theta CCMP2712]